MGDFGYNVYKYEFKLSTKKERNKSFLRRDDEGGPVSAKTFKSPTVMVMMQWDIALNVSRRDIQSSFVRVEEIERQSW
jgi:hypothetical protein